MARKTHGGEKWKVNEKKVSCLLGRENKLAYMKKKTCGQKNIKKNMKKVKCKDKRNLNVEEDMFVKNGKHINFPWKKYITQTDKKEKN